VTFLVDFPFFFFSSHFLFFPSRSGRMLEADDDDDEGRGARPCVKVRGLPLHLSAAALHELFSHYGAIRSRALTGRMVPPQLSPLCGGGNGRCSGGGGGGGGDGGGGGGDDDDDGCWFLPLQRGSAVLEFPSEEAANLGVASLNGLRLWSHTLKATVLSSSSLSTLSTSSSFGSSSSSAPLFTSAPPFAALPQPLYSPQLPFSAQSWAQQMHNHQLMLQQHQQQHQQQPAPVAAEVDSAPEQASPPLDVNVVANIVKALCQSPQCAFLSASLRSIE